MNVRKLKIVGAMLHIGHKAC